MTYNSFSNLFSSTIRKLHFSFSILYHKKNIKFDLSSGNHGLNSVLYKINMNKMCRYIYIQFN